MRLTTLKKDLASCTIQKVDKFFPKGDFTKKVFNSINRLNKTKFKVNGICRDIAEMKNVLESFLKKIDLIEFDQEKFDEYLLSFKNNEIFSDDHKAKMLALIKKATRERLLFLLDKLNTCVEYVPHPNPNIRKLVEQFQS